MPLEAPVPTNPSSVHRSPRLRLDAHEPAAQRSSLSLRAPHTNPPPRDAGTPPSRCCGPHQVTPQARGLTATCRPASFSCAHSQEVGRRAAPAENDLPHGKAEGSKVRAVRTKEVSRGKFEPGFKLADEVRLPMEPLCAYLMEPIRMVAGHDFPDLDSQNGFRTFSPSCSSFSVCCGPTNCQPPH